jgi:hypothetical protein
VSVKIFAELERSFSKMKLDMLANQR